MRLNEKLRSKLINWLIHEPPPQETPPCDFNRLKYEIRPGDVLLIEGRSRVSQVIRTISQSPWTHAALYIGRMNDIENEKLYNLVRQSTDKKENVHLIVEGLMDLGTVISPLSIYRNQHIRICRPIGISPSDVEQVITYAVRSLGKPYNLRQILDLARFILPWSILPRRWASSLFRTSTGEPESGICSTLIAEAFTSVQFPILPFMKTDENAELELIPRNPHLFTPKDFDYSPYFEIIKYPLFNPEEPLPYYRRLPWTKKGIVHHDDGIFSDELVKKKIKKSPSETPPDNNDDPEISF